MRSLAKPLLAIVLALSPAGASQAGPPDRRCEQQFIGRWKTSVGITRLRADGTAVPECADCKSHLVWWCRGNILTLNSPPASHAADMTLSADGQTLSGYKGEMIWVRMK